MTQLFQTTDSNPIFSTKGNGQFGNVIRTGWVPSKLGEPKKNVIIQYLNNSDVDKVYKRGNKIFAFYLNGTESLIA